VDGCAFLIMIREAKQEDITCDRVLRPTCKGFEKGVKEQAEHVVEFTAVKGESCEKC
jgi:hypothetical protein